MRLPKFRCKNKVGNWCFFTVLHNGNVDEENFDLETLSEFTGLLDNQGVEIYEGDVVNIAINREIEWSFKNGYIGVIEYDNATLNVGVNEHEYSQFICGFICKPLNYFGSMTEYCTEEFYQSQCKVIGNIYENSNLLGDNIEQN